MLRVLLILLSFTGFAIALYFVLLQRRIVTPDMGFLPRFCRLEDGNCRRILEAPEARLFGVSNSVVGAVYYFIIFALTVNVWVPVPPAVVRWTFLASLIASFTGLMLARTLIRKMEAPCVLCFTAHAINIAISLLLYYNL